MARARNIKPGFFLNDKLSECDMSARLLFIGLWCIADREGRLKDRPKRIKAEVFPYDDIDVEPLLAQLQENGFIIRYTVEEHQYIQVVNFHKHQNPHVKEAESTLPPCPNYEQAPEKHHTCTVLSPDKHSSFPADSLIPDSLIPDSGFSDSLITTTPQNVDESDDSPTSSRSQVVPAKEIFEAWNSVWEETPIPKMRELTKARRTWIKREYNKRRENLSTVEDFIEFFEYLRDDCPFIRDSVASGKTWFSFDWLFKWENNLAKALEGNYERR